MIDPEASLGDPSDLAQDVFAVCRAGKIPAFEGLLELAPKVVNIKLHCYESTDVHGMVGHLGAKRCYTFTGKTKDGFTYPLHVAAESGHKVCYYGLGSSKRGSDF